jgi:hypothetical protein
MMMMMMMIRMMMMMLSRIYNNAVSFRISSPYIIHKYKDQPSQRVITEEYNIYDCSTLSTQSRLVTCALVEMGCLKALRGGGEGALGRRREARDISRILLDGCSGAGK